MRVLVFALIMLAAVGAICGSFKKLQQYYNNETKGSYHYRSVVVCEFFMLVGVVTVLAVPNHYFNLWGYLNERIKDAAVILMMQDDQQMRDLLSLYKEKLTVTSYVTALFSIGVAVFSLASNRQSLKINPYPFEKTFNTVAYIYWLVFVTAAVVYFQVVQLGVMICLSLLILASTSLAFSIFYHLLQKPRQIEYNMAKQLKRKIKSVYAKDDSCAMRARLRTKTSAHNTHTADMTDVIDELILWQRCLMHTTDIDLSIQTAHHFDAFKVLFSDPEIQEICLARDGNLPFVFGYYTLYPSREKENELHKGYFRFMLQCVSKYRSEFEGKLNASFAQAFVSGLILARFQQEMDSMLADAGGNGRKVDCAIRLYYEILEDCFVYLENSRSCLRSMYLSGHFYFCVLVYYSERFDFKDVKVLIQAFLDDRNWIALMRNFQIEELEPQVEKTMSFLSYKMWRSPCPKWDSKVIAGFVRKLIEEVEGDSSCGISSGLQPMNRKFPQTGGTEYAIS